MQPTATLAQHLAGQEIINRHSRWYITHEVAGQAGFWLVHEPIVSWMLHGYELSGQQRRIWDYWPAADKLQMNNCTPAPGVVTIIDEMLVEIERLVDLENILEDVSIGN